jgi:hypothetical protein
VKVAILDDYHDIVRTLAVSKKLAQRQSRLYSLERARRAAKR